jgi:hypothetical protein
MPDKSKKYDPKIDRFLQNNPQFQDLFEDHAPPTSVTDPDYRSYQNRTQNDEDLKGRSRLYYYKQLLDEKLREKNPQKFDQAIKDINKDPNPTPRLEKANEIINSGTFKQSLNNDEIKKVLGDSYEDFNALRNKQDEIFKSYHPDSKGVAGTKENTDQAANTSYGLRNSALYQRGSHDYELTSQKDNSLLKKFAGVADYNPKTGYDFTFNNQTPGVNEPETKVNSNQYARRLKSVDPEYDDRTIIHDKDGTTLKKPGWNFYKTYDDGTREPVDEGEFETWRGFNKLPEHIKSKFVENTDITKLSEENKQKAQDRLKKLAQIPQ